MIATTPPRILAIAGSDSSGGAGVQADIKTIAMLGGYAMTAITAVTAQNTRGVTGVETLEAGFVAAQVDACLSDIGADAVKIGMLGSPASARVVAERLDSFSGGIVFDPVMVATSGAVLADEETIAAFASLMDIATLVTPNLPELHALTEMPIGSVEEIGEAAARLAARHDTSVLAKGGHGDGARVMDILVAPGGEAMVFDDARLPGGHTHGTGCTLSSAIATMLGHGQALPHAVRLARQFVRAAIEQAPGFGGGNGPLGHQAVRALA
ncbi:bifunctional hydroxymethylpyrimidine kinase/phosphomethylpyrimidine kinase [Qipengyuania sediminis]|uniref:bifunctional hydroxymethylpyrimidine kinase/phosphomethylpyrimidine kinase n=1 Tax=Qipengyuania sediminis TaxID=1532023 RepID=UPI00105A6CA5|nr:bifunctional hydroxymethylpyrimidine kinase/phosphomethylpyrimidine kinase [Qipengyuania sediminis]